MNSMHLRRRGVTLALVLIAMALVGGLLTVLAACAAQRYRDRQADRVRLVARALADSAAAYARPHLGAWSRTPPEEGVRLDVHRLLPPKMAGSAAVTVVTIEGRNVCRVSAQASRGVYAAADQIDLEMN